MADLTVTNPSTANGVAADPQAAAASDRIPVTRTRRYLLRIANGGGAPTTITLDDPNSVLPLGGSGAPTTFADVPITVPNGDEFVYMIDADRFVDANGWVNLTAAPITSVVYEIYGPL